MIRRILRAARCRVGLHRWAVLYRDVGEDAHAVGCQYVREVVCLYCRRVAEGRK